MKTKHIILFFLAIFLNQFCRSQITLDSTEIEQTIVATNLNIPWDMTYGSDGWVWFTELSGKISRLNPTTYELQEIFEVPNVAVFGFGAGMHSIVLHPDFEQTPHVYLHYTDSETSSRIVLYTFDANNNTLITPINILSEIPGGLSHNGSRMIIDNDKLFIALGDSYSAPESALDLTELSGKFLRMNLDGSIPNDNPIPNSRIWSWGHRNPQGFCKGNGMFYSSEHGTSIDDEINIIQENRNYGWPEVEGFCDEPDEIAYCDSENVTEPIWVWANSIAPCGIDYYGSSAIPEWENSLILAVLKDKELIQLKLNEAGDEIIEQNIFLENTYGRLRDVLTLPDGRIFFCTTNRDFFGSPSDDDDKIIELKAVSSVSTPSLETVNSFSIYPNPAKTYITIKSNEALNGQLEILDLTGKIVRSKTINNTNNYTINLEGISTGFYSIQLTSNNKYHVSKFLIN